MPTGRGFMVGPPLCSDARDRAHTGIGWAALRQPVPTGAKGEDMGFILGAIYVVLLITLGILSIRKGHWVMFIIGIFIPLFWIIGALMPRKELR